MKVNPDEFDKNSDAFIDEFLTLLAKYDLHDNNSKVTINTNGFRMEVNRENGCPPGCRMRSVTEKGPNGKLIKVRRCVCP